MQNLQAKTKEYKSIRKYFLKYLDKMAEYHSACIVENHHIINRKEVSGKLSAAKRFYNQAISYKDKINLPDSIWHLYIRELQIEHQMKVKSN